MFQKTIKKIVKFTGTGIHTGELAEVVLKPLPEGSGVVFKKNNSKFLLGVESVFSTSRSITIGDASNNIMTVEHLIAALYMCGIRNVQVEIDGPEIPIMDGSSASFVDMIKAAGIVKQKKKDEIINIKDSILVESDGRFIKVLPADKFGISYIIDFEHPNLHNQHIVYKKITDKIFRRKIAPARTFGFLSEVEALHERGLAMAGSIENAVVLTDTGYLNEKLRFKDECLRHKVLDLIGAISILGKPINGYFVVYKSGHSLDFELIKKIYSVLISS